MSNSFRFFNNCDQTAIEALRYLAEHPKPIGGEQPYNSAHLLQIADELEREITLFMELLIDFAFLK